MKWRIDEIEAVDGVITGVKYHVSHQIEETTVESEGNWTFRHDHQKVPFEQVTEEMIAEWLEEDEVIDGTAVITGRILEQHEELNKTKVIPPWKPQIFIPNL